MLGELVPGRECGDCHVCCVALTINEPVLQKVSGFRCRNLSDKGGCRIYADRPKTCRSFECGWRLLKFVAPGLRPDRSAVLLRFQRRAGEGLGIIVTLLDRSALKAEGLAETVAAAVAAGIPVYVNVPGKPGYTSAQARIDEVLAHAVATLDKPAVLEALRQALRAGRSGKLIPIRLGPPKDDLTLA